MSQPEVTISLRIVGASLDPERISALLGCGPSLGRRCGEFIEGSRHVVRQPTGVWILEAETRDAQDVGFDSRVANLLGRLTSDMDVWKLLSQEFRVELFCGVFIRTINDGFSIGATTLQELARRQISLDFDIYSVTEE